MHDCLLYVPHPLKRLPLYKVCDDSRIEIITSASMLFKFEINNALVP